MVSPIVVRFFSLAKWPSRANFDRSHDRFSKNFNFGPILGPLGGPGGPEEARYQVKVSGNHDSSPVRPISSSRDQIWTLGALQVPLGPSKGPLGAKTGPFGGPGGPEEARYQVKVSGNHNSSPVRPIGGSLDQIWTLRAFQVPLGPEKGL